MKILLLLLALLTGAAAVSTAREFTHPGSLYSQADLDRMRAMVQAHREPYYSAFQALKSSRYSSYVDRTRGNQITEGKFNQTVGEDGRRAHDMALLWHLTGDESYARSVVKILNFSSYYTNTSARGTAPLDNGKIWLLLEAAELMRDYPGWAAADRERFKAMLVYPGYSGTAYPDGHYSLDDAANDITFYWNIYNFDAGRFGNQGLFAARAMMAMGVFLDNEKIYDRAYRYLTGQTHRADDLPYVPGPPITSSQPYELDADNPTAGDGTTSFMLGYQLKGRQETVQDYGYDEQLRYYIYANGQSQEACRDQDHSMVGVGLYVDIAEIAWNQGDDLYGHLDNRILKGLEWCFRYNLSYLLDPAKAWEPTGYTTDQSRVTLANGRFLRVRSRSGRWQSVAQSTKGRGDSFMAGGNRECALAHYAVRAGLDAADTDWTSRYLDYMTANYGRESYGKDANHAYEWAGWGTLTKHREASMAGDPGRWTGGSFDHVLHATGAGIRYADYDRHHLGASGRTCSGNAAGSRASGAYRTDGGMNIDPDGNVSGLTPGDWMCHTVNIPAAGDYDVVISYSATAPSRCRVSVDGGTPVEAELPAGTDRTYAVTVTAPAGVSVLRHEVTAPGEGLTLKSFAVQPFDESRHTSVAPVVTSTSRVTVSGNRVTAAGAAQMVAYDKAGRCVATAGGDTLVLPCGVYVISVDGGPGVTVATTQSRP